MKEAFSHSGMSLVEVLILSSLFAVSSLYIIDLVQIQRGSLKHLEQKNNNMKQQLILDQLSEQTDFCNFIFLDPSQESNRSKNTINVSKLSSEEITFKTLPISPVAASPHLFEVGQPLSSSLTGLKTKSIKVTDFTFVTIDSFTASLEVLVESSATTTPLKSIRIPLRFETDPLSGITEKKMTSCHSAKSGPTDQCTKLGGQVDAVTGECKFYSGLIVAAQLIHGEDTAFQVRMLEPGYNYQIFTSSSPYHLPNKNPPASLTSDYDVIFARRRYRVNLPYKSSCNKDSATYCHDSIHCNLDKGWVMKSCMNSTTGRDNDVSIIENGCASNDFYQNPKTILTIICSQIVK